MTLRLSRIVNNGTYIPQLDGLRFVAIIAVLLFHANERISSISQSKPFIYYIFETGWFGVELFFGISAYILCKQLQQNKTTSYLSYLNRRVNRIEPPFFIAIAIQTILLLLFSSTHGTKELLNSSLHVLTYITNFTGNNLINKASWSLEIEIQFYLILPLILLIINRLVPKKLQVFTLLAIGSLPLIVVSQHLSLYTVLPYFSAGMIAALLEKKDTGSHKLKYAGWINSLLIILLFATASSYFINMIPTWLLVLLRVALMVALFYSLLVRQWGVFPFSIGWISKIGGMCYSIYLYHLPVMGALGSIILTKYALNYGLSIALLVLSSLIVSIPLYILFERPFMRSAKKSI